MNATDEGRYVWDRAIELVRDCNRLSTEFGTGELARHQVRYDPRDLALLKAHGYIAFEGDRVVPKPRAYEADFIDRSLDEVEALIEGIGSPIMDRLEDILTADMYRGPTPIEVDRPLHGLLSEGWIKPHDRNGAYALTSQGYEKLRRTLVQYHLRRTGPEGFEPST